MYPPSRLLIFRISVAIVSLSTVLALETQSAAQPVPVSSSESRSPEAVLSPSPAIEPRISKLEAKVSELEKKAEVRPKDTWDKLAAISGLISGLLIAVIGAFVTMIFKRRETALLEAQSKREDEDRKAKLELEILGNKRAETQLEIERQNKEREIAISQAQAVQTLLPSLQSSDQKTKETALMLIAFFGNPDLAAKLSTLYQTDIAPTLEAIATMPGLKLEQRRQAAAALGLFGRSEEAANTLLELSSQPAASTEERLVIAKELETLGDKEKAARVQLELAIDPQVESEKRRNAVETLKRLEHTEQAKEELLRTARNDKLKSSKRIAAIDALLQLDETQKAEEWTAILTKLIHNPEMDPKEFGMILGALRRLGHTEEVTEVMREIATDSRFAAKLRLVAATDYWEAGNKEEALKILGEIADSREATYLDRMRAAEMQVKFGNPDVGKEKKQKIMREMGVNLLSIFKGWTRKNRSSRKRLSERQP